jgi:hypothetical protein
MMGAVNRIRVTGIMEMAIAGEDFRFCPDK